MATVIETVRNIFRIEELRQRIVFTALMLVVVRIGAHITIPGIDIEALKASTATSDPNNLFGLYDLFVGGAFHNAAIFAMGIMPYISASIILQLAGVFVPELMKLQREGEEGRRKINQWTRYLTVFVAAMQALGLSIKLTATTAGIGGQSIVVAPGILFTLTAVAVMTAGTIFLM